MSQVFTSTSKAIIPICEPTLFLGGSNEMYKSFDWQIGIIKHFESDDVVILNPTDSKHIDWHLDGLDAADCVIMYFEEEIMPPMSLMSLSYCAGKVYAGDIAKTIVYCRNSAWRASNIEILSKRSQIKIFGGDHVEFYEEVRQTLLRNYDRRTSLKGIW